MKTTASLQDNTSTAPRSQRLIENHAWRGKMEEPNGEDIGYIVLKITRTMILSMMCMYERV